MLMKARLKRINNALTDGERELLGSNTKLEYVIEQISYRPPKRIVEADIAIALHLMQSRNPRWSHVNVNGRLKLGKAGVYYQALVDIDEINSPEVFETSNLRPPVLKGLRLEIIDTRTQSDPRDITFYADTEVDSSRTYAPYSLHCRRIQN